MLSSWVVYFVHCSQAHDVILGIVFCPGPGVALKDPFWILSNSESWKLPAQSVL